MKDLSYLFVVLSFPSKYYFSQNVLAPLSISCKCMDATKGLAYSAWKAVGNRVPRFSSPVRVIPLLAMFSRSST